MRSLSHIRAARSLAEGGVAVLGVALAASALAIGFSGPDESHRAVRGVADALVIFVPIAVGLYAMRRDRTDRFPRLLVIAGLAFAPGMLALSSESVTYSIGRVWAWGAVAWLVYLLLAFPLGRLTTRADRLVVASTVFLVTTLYMPSALFADFPDPSPWSGCVTDCPANAFMVTPSAPGVGATLTHIRDALTVVVYIAAAAIIARRWAHSSGIARRVHGPVLVLALAHFVASGTFVAARGASPGADATNAAAVITLLSMPALMIGFLVSLMRWRLIALNTVRQLGPEIHGAEGARHIRDLIADAIRDPTLEIGYWQGDDGGWIDEDGRPFALPPKGTRRVRTEVSSEGRPVAVLLHDNAYLAEPAIQQIVRGMGLMALENRRLEANARATVRELSESRARIVAAIDNERMRIERDLHDGAQQRLIALKIVAERGAEAVKDESDNAAELFQRIGADAGAALDEVRSLARGMYPPLLVDYGLVEALNDAVRRSPVPAEVRAHNVGRYPQEVEAAVYFCCLEALQNAEKHAGGCSVTISLAGNGGIRFEVRDDGCGFDSSGDFEGAGLRNMRDRIRAVDGTLRIDSVPGSGTCTAGSIPLAPSHVPVEIERLVLRSTDALEDALGIYRAVRSASGAIVDFAVEHVNDAACQAVGLSREAQVGKTLGQLRPGYVHSDAFRWHCDALESSGPFLREESEYAWTAGGRRLQVAYEVRATNLGAGRLALVWREITDRKRAEDQMRFRAEVTAREGDGVCVVRADAGVIAYANPRFEQMLGYESGELEGRPVSELEWDDPPAGPGTVSELRLRRRDGAEIWCETVVDGFEDVNLGWCWVGVHRDITVNREEKERMRLYGERLQDALHSLPALAYTADRELRCTLLFDNLVDPRDVTAGRTGSDMDLFGRSLAQHVGELNRRVFVTARPARAELGVDLHGPATVVVVVEPVLARDGMVAGLVGSVLDRTSSVEGAALVEAAGSGRRRAARLRRQR